MLKRDLKISVVCVLFGVYTLSGGTTNDCNYALVFPTLNNSRVVTAEENSKVVLPFRLDLEPACSLPDDLEIEVFKSDAGRHGRRGAVCSIQHINGICRASMSTSCVCSSLVGTFEFRKTVQLTDNVTWIWRTSSGAQLETAVFFNITRTTPLERERKPEVVRNRSTVLPSLTTSWTKSKHATPEPGVTESTSFTTTNPKATAAASSTKDPQAEDATSPQSESNVVVIALVLGIVGIIAVAATVIAIVKICATRNRRNHYDQPQIGEPVCPDQGRQRRDSPEASQYHFYMEVPDDPPPEDAEAPEEAQEAPKPLPDDYLLPVPSGAAVGDAGGEQIPLSENSRSTAQ